MPLHVAIDFGLTNIDAVLRNPNGKLESIIVLGDSWPILTQFEAVLETFGHPAQDFEWIAVTGGQFRQLPSSYRSARLIAVSEVPAIGRGGQHLAGLPARGLRSDSAHA